MCGETSFCHATDNIWLTDRRHGGWLYVMYISSTPKHLHYLTEQYMPHARLLCYILHLHTTTCYRVPGLSMWLRHRIAHIIKTQFMFAMGYYHAQDHTIQRLRDVHAGEQREEVVNLLKFMTKFARKSQVSLLKVFSTVSGAV